MQTLRDYIGATTAVLLAAILAVFGWFAKRAMTSLDAKLDRAEYEQDMIVMKSTLSSKAEQRDIDNQFQAVQNSLTSVDTKLNLILSQMIRK